VLGVRSQLIFLPEWHRYHIYRYRGFVSSPEADNVFVTASKLDVSILKAPDSQARMCRAVREHSVHVCVCVSVCGRVCVCVCVCDVVECDQEINLEICRILFIFWFKIKLTDLKSFVFPEASIETIPNTCSGHHPGPVLSTFSKWRMLEVILKHTKSFWLPGEF